MDVMQLFLDSSSLITDGSALAERMRRDGYLFLPGLLPRDDVAAVQRQIAEIAREARWLRPDRPVQEAIADLLGFCVDPDPTYLKTLRRINRLEDYHALKHHPVLIDLLERMLGGAILPHPRVLMRNIFPQRDEYTTKAHQDYPNVQGTTEVYTAWMPLIDCPLHVGPLQIAAGSHTSGVYDFGIAGGAGGIEITDPLEGRWVCGDFAAGDVLLFHSMTVHKGLPNRSDRLRMSMDVRYQLASEPFNIDNANPDGQPLSWEEVYADWHSDALKYYWRRLPLTLQSFDPQWFDKRDALGFELGEAGDQRARSVLQRIVARDANPEKRARAQKLLDALP
jgi:ectoine hydroxylase-related dioxygenase (phytanoyl-CoA dioxygenase family)